MGRVGVCMMCACDRRNVVNPRCFDSSVLPFSHSLHRHPSLCMNHVFFLTLVLPRTKNNKEEIHRDDEEMEEDEDMEEDSTDSTEGD